MSAALWLRLDKFTRDYRVLWRKRDGTATLSRGECPDPCLDRLLLLFWAHYIKDGPYLPFTENKGEDVANYIKKRRIFSNVKGKVVELDTLVLGRFSIDFRKLL